MASNFSSIVLCTGSIPGHHPPHVNYTCPHFRVRLTYTIRGASHVLGDTVYVFNTTTLEVNDLTSADLNIYITYYFFWQQRGIAEYCHIHHRRGIRISRRVTSGIVNLLYYLYLYWLFLHIALSLCPFYYFTLLYILVWRLLLE